MRELILIGIILVLIGHVLLVGLSWAVFGELVGVFGVDVDFAVGAVEALFLLDHFAGNMRGGGLTRIIYIERNHDIKKSHENPRKQTNNTTPVVSNYARPNYEVP